MIKWIEGNLGFAWYLSVEGVIMAAIDNEAIAYFYPPLSKVGIATCLAYSSINDAKQDISKAWGIDVSDTN